MSNHQKNQKLPTSNNERLETQREMDQHLRTSAARKSSFLPSRTKSLGQRLLNFVGKQISVDYQERLVLKSLQAENNNAKKIFEKLLARKNNLKNLTNFHLSLLNDKAIENVSLFQRQTSCKIFIDKLLTKKLLRIFKPFVDNLTQHIKALPLLYPESTKIVLWDILAISSKLYFLYLIPLELAWTSRSLLYNRYYSSTIIMLIILVVDFIIGLNTAYYNAGSLITNRIQIFKHQITKSLGLEWISTIILIILFIICKSTDIMINVTENPVYLILLSVLSHQINVHYKTSQYELALNLSKKVSSCLELLKFLLLLFYVIHLFSCLWFWVGNYSRENYEFTWLDTLKDLPIIDWTDEYLQSFYYVCVTMFTVGYGDITPKSGLEKSICIFLILISSIQLPYSINTVGSIIEKISDYGEETRNKLRTINSYMNKKRVPYNIQNQIRQYLNHYWESLQGQDTEEEKVIISQLSENLREQLIIQANSRIFAKVPLLQLNFSHQLQQSLLKKVQSIQLQPEQIIELDNKISCYFVDEGEINLLIESGLVIQKAKKDDVIGLENLFLGFQSKNQRLKSIGFTKLQILSRQDFLQDLKDFPNDYEKFCAIKDDLLFNFKSSYIQKQCDSCFQTGHEIINCQMLHYVPQKDLLIKRCQYPKKQTRREFERRIVLPELDNQEFNETKSQFIKKYYIPQQAININNIKINDKLNEQNTLSNIQDDVIEQQDQKMDNLRVSTTLNQKQQFKRESVLAISYIPGNNIDQIKRSINNNKKVGLNQSNKKQQLDIQLESIGLQRQNSLTSRRQSQAVNMMNIYQLSLNNNAYKQNYLQELISTNYDINFDEELRARYDNLNQIKNMSPEDKQAIELLYLKQVNKQKYQKKGLMEFETIKCYHDYFPQYNLNRQISKANKPGNPLLKTLIQKYINYILYPSEFVSKFKLLQSDQQRIRLNTEEEKY
ncbi:unnamed protein product (macronuclear) [Paramecium tetraurelia]|uniref:Potassium channel domain-containing protein n=1 Tax=Paramecium tetraurelia TaxID=5888 RepID=A0BDN9_PARTE|nr:uncharacterized protein GSPATT00027686001 [Paramecium tetraurelia]CAK56656.1 unnamed protein product [Paramecium tetraurelia]|eukprot:XP_001424054.1 hypothetical protein (macronuclear) [Paramecium tetraurelia strain d4-2]